MFKPIITPRDKAERFHRCLPEHIRQYLKDRGIPATIIDRQLLGWDGDRVTIPIFGRAGEVLGFRYAKLPDNLAGEPEITSEEGAPPELYGWETMARIPYRVVICEGEFDRLVLEARGFPAVTSTAGVNSFLQDWVPHFAQVREIYVCFNRTAVSDEAAKKIQTVLPRARVARLPADIGANGSISRFFVDLGKEEIDFEVVLAGAFAAEPETKDPSPVIRTLRPVHESLRRRAERLKEAVSLHELLARFTMLQASGANLVGHCPLHDDRSASLTVFLDTETYRCSACGAEGDVVTFLMDKESMTFGQALEALERFEFTHELYGTY
jgi:DNA primase